MHLIISYGCGGHCDVGIYARGISEQECSHCTVDIGRGGGENSIIPWTAYDVGRA